MEGKFDEAKGRAKEAIGDLTDDDEMRREGKTDRMAGEVKQKAEQAKDKVNDVIDDVTDRLKR